MRNTEIEEKITDKEDVEIEDEIAEYKEKEVRNKFFRYTFRCKKKEYIILDT